MPSTTRPRSTRPFLAAPRTAFYHPSRLIDAARCNLERAIRRSEGIGMVVGPPGTGKSLLLSVIAEQLRDDFDVALLTGARICTRRALWQSILAELGEPYRGIDEADLRIGLLERIRGLSATGSGLVILVDEAHTLPVRLLEELRLLSNVPTPLPAVHVVLAGTTDLEERLACPRLEPLSQRIAVRGYLEPLDHAETLAYLRSQCAAAGTSWEALFDGGCEDAVFTITDGVPRLINQLCDHALLRGRDQGKRLVTRGDIEEAWGQIQQLPSPTGAPAAAASGSLDSGVAGADDDRGTMIEFGSLDDEPLVRHDVADRVGRAAEVVAFEPPTTDPWQGPEVEFVFDSGDDPFQEYFEREEQVVERMLVRGPDDFRERMHVASREGADLAGRLDAWERTGAAGDRDVSDDPADERRGPEQVPCGRAVTATLADGRAAGVGSVDDSDMVVIEEDERIPADDFKRSIFAVRPGDYRSLFARLRRGDGDSTAR